MPDGPGSRRPQVFADRTTHKKMAAALFRLRELNTTAVEGETICGLGSRYAPRLSLDLTMKNNGCRLPTKSATAAMLRARLSRALVQARQVYAGRLRLQSPIASNPAPRMVIAVVCGSGMAVTVAAKVSEWLLLSTPVGFAAK